MLIKSAVAGVPDIREDVILAIKNAMDSGKYHPPAELVAEKIIRESLMSAALLT
jgi:anti-sigma28 factor (negative regulator of flagellin synthesis)